MDEENTFKSNRSFRECAKHLANTQNVSVLLELGPWAALLGIWRLSPQLRAVLYLVRRKSLSTTHESQCKAKPLTARLCCADSGSPCDGCRMWKKGCLGLLTAKTHRSWANNNIDRDRSHFCHRVLHAAYCSASVSRSHKNRIEIATSNRNRTMICSSMNSVCIYIYISCSTLFYWVIYISLHLVYSIFGSWGYKIRGPKPVKQMKICSNL